MKPLAWRILGILLILFGIGQILQAAGLLGTREFTFFGLAFAGLGLVGGFRCLRRAAAPPPP